MASKLNRNRRPSSQACLESLENRQLFSSGPVFGNQPIVTLNNGLLTIVGTPQNDTVSVTYQPVEGPIVTSNPQTPSWTVVVDGQSQQFGNVISSVQIFLGGGDDSVQYVGTFQVVTLANADAPTTPANGGAFISGGAGSDTISLSASMNDTLRGGDGADSINSSGGGDLIYGGRDNDTILGQGGGTVLGQGGNDSLQGASDDFANSAISLVEGGAGNDTLVGGTNEIIAGVEGGAMTTTYGSLKTYLYGNAGNDSITGGLGGGDLLGGGPGQDTLVGSTNAHDVDTLRSIHGSDELRPGPNDVLQGGGNPHG